MAYIPLNYEQLNIHDGTFIPSTVHNRNNLTYSFWERALFQRASSVLKFELPEEWQGNIRDFFIYCLFRFGYVAVSKDSEHGLFFQPCNLSGYNFYYQPVTALINNPALKAGYKLEIGKDCELIKLTPDYRGVWDIVSYYAEKLSVLDTAINLSLINNKFSWFMAAKNKAAAEALKKLFDKVNSGEPAVFFDKALVNDPQSKTEPWQFLERKNLKESYLTTDQLKDFQTLLNNFDTEIGIPTIPYQKAERMVTSEAESRTIDSTSRSIVWLETLESSIDKVNKMYGTVISVSLRYKQEEEAQNEFSNNDN